MQFTIRRRLTETATSRGVLHSPSMEVKPLMRRITCDQDEFEVPESEQSLSLAVSAASRRCPDLEAFLAACEKSDLPRRALPAKWHRWQQVALHLQRIAFLDLPAQEHLRESRVASDDWNDVELVLAFDSVFVWYHWCTSA
ncbi:hypothetical protein [Aeoliella sp.]|uniref:hypothetical protein n=1 Tax=Aeoliella sp. TaxID=2795800 RepID=UPI003CCBEF69